MRLSVIFRVALGVVLATVVAVGVSSAPVSASDDGTMACPLCVHN